MNLTPDSKAKTMLFQEGAVLQFAGNYGRPAAGEYARSVADGCVNAIVRIEGPEAAAGFAFAMADRVTGNVKALTVWSPAASLDAPEPPPPDPVPVAVVGDPPSLSRSGVIVIEASHAVLIATVIAIAAFSSGLLL